MSIISSFHNFLETNLLWIILFPFCQIVSSLKIRRLSLMTYISFFTDRINVTECITFFRGGLGGAGWEGNLLALTLYLSRRRKSMTSIVFNPVLDLKSYFNLANLLDLTPIQTSKKSRVLTVEKWIMESRGSLFCRRVNFDVEKSGGCLLNRCRNI